MKVSSKHSRRRKAKPSRTHKKSTPRASNNHSGKKSWRERRTNDVTFLMAQPLARLSWAVHGFSTRQGGASHLDKSPRCRGGVLNLGFTEWDTREAVEANRKAFLQALGADGMKLVTLKQIHSDAIHLTNDAPANSLSVPACSGDALITRTRGLLLAVQTADCVPVLLADHKLHAVAAIHAGWRGTLARIVAKTVGRMNMEFGSRPQDLVASIGPAIGRCSYEVGPEVAQAFAGQFPNAREWFDFPHGLRDGQSDEQFIAGEGPNPLKWLSMMPPGHDAPPPSVNLDLMAANRWQLLDAGVPAKNIVASKLCTACNTDILFSHRRENGRTGRMLAAIGLRP
ncbi:MAG TPA: peptidoglycan editing factor PgeF [Candidatus Limnocylindrales bacterium]|nr:peptidoglycan editing factor PgeF [Candidatus Limnocylindrales bacterium]